MFEGSEGMRRAVTGREPRWVVVWDTGHGVFP